MSVKEIVSSWAGTAQELANHLNAKTIEVKDETFYTSRQLVNVIGPDHYRVVSATINQASQLDPLLADLFTTLKTTGISFADPLTQEMIDQLSVMANWPGEIATLMKEMGIKFYSIAEKELGQDVTELMAEELLAAAGRDRVQSDLAAATNEILEVAKSAVTDPDSYRSGIVSALRAMADELEAG